MRTALAALVAAFLLSACQPAPQPVDLAPLQNAVTNLNEIVTVLNARLDVLGDRVVRLDDNVRADLATLNTAAADLHALVRQPITLADVNWTDISLLAITTSANSVNFLVFTPGECPEEVPAGLVRVPATEALASILVPAPTGPHCLSLDATESRQAASVTVEAVEGGVLAVNLFPALK